MSSLIKHMRLKFSHILAILIIFPLIDYIYLSTIGQRIFAPAIKNIQGFPMNFKIQYAIAAYIFLLFGFYYFILRQLNPNKSWKPQIFHAFLFGFTVYGIYETTNAAIIDKWDLPLVIIDTIWGGILYASITTISFFITQHF